MELKIADSTFNTLDDGGLHADNANDNKGDANDGVDDADGDDANKREWSEVESGWVESRFYSGWWMKFKWGWVQKELRESWVWFLRGGLNVSAF